MIRSYAEGITASCFRYLCMLAGARRLRRVRWGRSFRRKPCPTQELQPCCMQRSVRLVRSVPRCHWGNGRRRVSGRNIPPCCVAGLWETVGRREPSHSRSRCRRLCASACLSTSIPLRQRTVLSASMPLPGAAWGRKGESLAQYFLFHGVAGAHFC